MDRHLALATLLLISASAAAQSVAPNAASAPLCAPDLPLPEVAARAADASAPPVEVRRAWALGDDAVARRCGLRALAATRDADLVAATVRALVRREARDDAWMFARWAAWAAGGPDAAASATFAPLLDVFRSDPAVSRAAGDDAVRLRGEIESVGARDALVAALVPDGPPQTIDAVIHALARQGDARARDDIGRLGHAEADALATNPTYEQARRIGAAAFYLLALGAGTRDDGLRLLGRLSPADQADAGAWAVQTLCERAVRRPAEAITATAARAALVEALDQRGIGWATLTRGTFTCPAR